MYSYRTIQVRRDGSITRLQFYRPDANNTINELLATECKQALDECRDETSVLVLEGLPEVFCFGLDFQALAENPMGGGSAETLYDIWLDLATGPYVSVAHVRGKANSLGLGFVAACDIVLAEDNASFSMSDLLFGIAPACALPFLVRRLGVQRTNHLTLMTTPLSAQQAALWGLIDAYQANSASLLGKHLQRLQRLTKESVALQKRHAASLGALEQARESALATHAEVFSNPETMAKLTRYVQTGVFPWE